MKIAMLTNNYKPIVGGVPVSVERLSAALRRRGHDVTIFAPHMAGENPEEGVVRLRSRKLPSGYGVALPDPFDKTIDRNFNATGFDMVHVHHPFLMGKIGLRLAKERDIPIAFTYHTRYECYLHYFPPYALGKKLYGKDMAWAQKMMAAHNRCFMNACDMVFAPTPLIGSYLLAQQITTPVRLLSTGLGDESFAWDERLTAQVRAKHERKKYLFCSVSRLAKEKNISFLLQALACFKEIHGDCFQMLMIGDGPNKSELEREAFSLGIGDNVIFTGNIPHADLSSYYRACDLFLFASQTETQGLVLQEAMAATLPVVAIKASGVCDIVRNGENGYMTVMDKSAFARAMENTLLHLRQYKRLSAGAYETAFHNTDDQMAEQAETSYIQMFGERHADIAKQSAAKITQSIPVQNY